MTSRMSRPQAPFRPLERISRIWLTLRANAVQALCLLRSRAAVAPLRTMLATETAGRTAPDVKMYATAALGALGQKTVTPLFAHVFYGVNYRLRSPMMESLMQQI